MVINLKQTYTYSNDKRWHMASKREVLNISWHHFKHVHSNQYYARFLKTTAYIWQIIINFADMSAFCHRVLQPLDSCIHIRKITRSMLHTYIQHRCIYIHTYTSASILGMHVGMYFKVRVPYLGNRLRV